jgi:hypothetical protein
VSRAPGQVDLRKLVLYKSLISFTPSLLIFQIPLMVASVRALLTSDEDELASELDDEEESELEDRSNFAIAKVRSRSRILSW